MASDTKTLAIQADTIIDLVQCPICYNDYPDAEPKILPCGHTACKKCLGNMVDQARREVKCHQCRAFHPVDPEKGIDGFLTNLSIKTLLDATPAKLKDDAALKGMCSIHKNDQLSMYCDTCCTEICTMCQFEKHGYPCKTLPATKKAEDMRTRFIPDIVQQLQSIVQTQEAVVKKRKADITSARSNLKQKLSLMAGASDRRLQQVERQFVPQQKRLTDRSEILLKQERQALKANQGAEKTAVNNGISTLERQMEQSGIVPKIQQATEALLKGKSTTAKPLRALMSIHSDLRSALQHLKGVAVIWDLKIEQTREQQAKEKELKLEVVETKWKERTLEEIRELKRDLATLEGEKDRTDERVLHMQREIERRACENEATSRKLSKTMKEKERKEQELRELKLEAASLRRDIRSLKGDADKKEGSLKEWLQAFPEASLGIALKDVTGRGRPVLLVHDIPSGLDPTDLEVFFNDQRNGGCGDVERVQFPLDGEHPTSAWITFEDSATVDRICSKTRELNGRALRLTKTNI